MLKVRNYNFSKTVIEIFMSVYFFLISFNDLVEHDELKSIRMTEFSNENKNYNSMNDVQEPFNESETQSSYHKNVLSKILCLTFLIVIFVAGLCIRIFVDIGLI